MRVTDSGAAVLEKLAAELNHGDDAALLVTPQRGRRYLQEQAARRYPGGLDHG